jgi:hypothetical protein
MDWTAWLSVTNIIQINKTKLGIEITAEIDSGDNDDLQFSRVTLQLSAGWALELFYALKTHESSLHQDMKDMDGYGGPTS